jgi:hypothetical protein
MTVPNTSKDAQEPVYECMCRGDDILLQDGIDVCAAHAMCRPCLAQGVSLALSDPQCFPAQCCGPLNEYHVKQVVPAEQMVLYENKSREFRTPRPLRVYCAITECQLFIPLNNHCHTGWYSVAYYSCGTKTCVGCKALWKDEDHRCDDPESISGQRQSLPDYTPDYRIKKCPECRLAIEFEEACNHMTCARCEHEFCFICMLPWTGFHSDDGCPRYGDPTEGYDDEGYEKSGRGIHLDTGLDRDGVDRVGRGRVSSSDYEEGYLPDDDEYGETDPDNWHVDPEWEEYHDSDSVEVHDDEQGWQGNLAVTFPDEENEAIVAAATT